MKTCIRILKSVGLACALAATCFAQMEFVGYMISPDGARYVLKKAGEDNASPWLALGDSYMGFKLLTHDRTHEIVVVEKDGARMEVPLKSARVLPLPPWRHKVQGTKIQFVGESSVSEEAVRELMQVRAGGEVNEVTLDRDIRAIYRIGHFESVEFKLEMVDANTRNLLVILKPKARDKNSSSK
jgi:hypothetical protein